MAVIKVVPPVLPKQVTTQSIAQALPDQVLEDLQENKTGSSGAAKKTALRFEISMLTNVAWEEGTQLDTALAAIVQTTSLTAQEGFAIRDQLLGL